MATDRNGTITYWNRAAEQLLGWPAAEVLGRDLITVVACEALRERARALLQGSAGRSGEGEVELYRRDGTSVPARVALSAALDAGGSPTGSVGICAEEREARPPAAPALEALQQTEHALRESNRRLTTLIQNLPGLVYGMRMDAHWTAEFLSDGCLDLTGYPAAAFFGPDAVYFEHLIHPDDRLRVRREVEAAVAEDRTFRLQYRIVARDGQEKWVWEQGQGVPGADGAVAYVEGFITEVTERVVAEHALRAREEQFRQLADAMPQLVWTAGPDGVVDYYNRRVEEYEGFARRPDGSWEWMPVLHPHDVERTARAWSEALRDGETYEVEHRVRRRDGAYRWLLSRGVPLRDARGRVVKWYGTATDIHEQKLAEVELAAAKARAEEMIRLKDAFLANMSHEIRTPLTSVIGFADMLAEEVQDGMRDIVGYIRDGGERLMLTLNSVLELAQIESGSLPISIDRVDLCVQTRKVLPLLQLQAQERGLYLHLECEEPHLAAMADRGAFSRVLTNLLSNAIKFTHEGGVTVRVRRNAGYAEVQVADTGIGISEAFMPHLFDEFWQESEGNTRAYGGVGLGLAITKRLVAFMNGTIAVESRKDAGTTFTVRLPLA